MGIEVILSILGLSISLGGFIPIFFLHDKVKEISIAFVLIFLAVISSIIAYNNYEHSIRISLLQEEVVTNIGKNLLTFDQLYENLYYEKQSDLTEGIEGLVKSGKVKHKIVELKDDYGETYRVRGYFID